MKLKSYKIRFKLQYLIMINLIVLCLVPDIYAEFPVSP